MNLLAKHSAFSGKKYRDLPVLVRFSYGDEGDSRLSQLRRTYKLDELAGAGWEVERIIRLMSWVHRLDCADRKLDPLRKHYKVKTGSLSREEKKALGCRFKTALLNDVYLAMGFCSRQTHLLPHSDEDRESHFVTSVFSQDLDRWIMMDPMYGVYVSDEQGDILGVAEIRRRLIFGRPLKAVHVGKTWLKRVLLHLAEYFEGADYFWFLSDFIFKIRCPQQSRLPQDTKATRVYFELLPDGYRENPLVEARLNRKGKKVYYLDDEDLFWQKPRQYSQGLQANLSDIG